MADQLYTPLMGQPRPLPTLTNQPAGYFHQRPLPAPYGRGNDGGGDFQGGNVITPTPQVPPPIGNQPTPQQPAPQYPQQPNQAPVNGGVAGQQGVYTGGVYTPKPAWYVTDRGAYRPIQFPGVKHSGSGRSWYEDGSMVDYGSPAWQKASGYQPPAQYSELWTALPDSWKVDLAGRDPMFVEKYLQAVMNGNNAQAQDIYKQSGDYRDQQNQAAIDQKRNRPATEYRDAPFYVPTR